jgi:hypothetical protein
VYNLIIHFPFYLGLVHILFTILKEKLNKDGYFIRAKICIFKRFGATSNSYAREGKCFKIDLVYRDSIRDKVRDSKKMLLQHKP